MGRPIKPRTVNNQTLAELHYKKACKFATAGEDLTSGYTEDHTTLTITKDATGVVTIDGGTLELDDHILVKDQTDTTENGIYKVTRLGSGSTSLILTREDHFNNSTECVSGKVYFTIVSSGLVNAHKSFFIGVGTEAATTTFGTTTFSVSGSAAASEITVEDESTDTECFPVFTTAATGNLAPKSGTNLTFNSNTGVLTATKFSGSLNMSDAGAGTLSTARGGTGNTSGTASLVTVTNSTANTDFPVVFHDESNALLDDTGSLTYNPSSGTLTGTTFVGSLSGNASGSSGSCTGNAATATLATTVTVTDSDVSTNFPIVFHDESNGLLDDTGSFLYNPNLHDLIIKGGNLNIQNSGGATNLSISTDGNIITDNKIGTAADQEYINFGTSNEVNTFVNNTERLSVTNTGVDITGNLDVNGNITGSYSGRILSKSYISGTTQNYMSIGTTYKHIFGGGGHNSLGDQVLEVEFTPKQTHGKLEYGLFLNSSTAGQVVHMGVTAVTGSNHIYDVTAGSDTYDARKQGLMDGSTTNVSVIELVDLDNHENFFQSGKFHFENLNVGTTYRMGLYARTHSSGSIVINSGGQYTSTSSSLTRNAHHECYLMFVEIFSDIVYNNTNVDSGY